MKTLAVIQTMAKIGRIVSKVLSVCCIVGLCISLVGIVSLALGVESFKLGGVTIQSMIENKADLNQPTLTAHLAVCAAFCAAYAFLCKAAETYFKNELADGTPFTQRGAREMLHLGILTAAVSLGTEIACSIGVSVAQRIAPGISDLPLDEYSSFGVGVAMIVLSLVLRCGAEQIEEKGGSAPAVDSPTNAENE